MMQVILKVSSSNLDYTGGDYAVVDITEELAKLTLRRMHFLREQKALDAAVCETYYWDCWAEYFGPRAVRQLETVELKEPYAGLDQILDRLEIKMRETVTAPPDFQVPEGQIVA